jgi:hypothetical protein
MTTDRRNPRTRTLATAATLVAAAGIMAGCGSEEPPETAAEIAIPTPGPTEELPGSTETAAAYVGPYDLALRESLADYSGEVVTLTGEVAEVVASRSSLEIVDPDNPDVDPLLVSALYAVPDVETGDVVEVTGTVQQNFSPPVVEPAVEGDPETGFYEQHLGEPYLNEAVVEAIGPATP